MPTITPLSQRQSDEIIRLVAELTGRHVRRLDDQVVADTIGWRVAHIRKGISRPAASGIIDALHRRIDAGPEVLPVPAGAREYAVNRLRIALTEQPESRDPDLLLQQVLCDLNIRLAVR